MRHTRDRRDTLTLHALQTATAILFACAALWMIAPATATAAESESDADASARETDADGLLWRPGFGARVGGYMFREESGDGVAWDGCRMDGAGLFATLDFTEHWFSELSFDFYAAHDDVVTHGMDRISLLSQVAAGFRMFPDWYVSPNVHLGGGLEWTSVDLTESGGPSGDAFLPIAFIGLGMDINAGDHFRLGANLRILAMGLPEHAHGDAHAAGHSHDTATQALDYDDPLGAGAASDEVEMTMTPAGQLILFVRYAL